MFEFPLGDQYFHLKSKVAARTSRTSRKFFLNLRTWLDFCFVCLDDIEMLEFKIERNSAKPSRVTRLRSFCAKYGGTLQCYPTPVD